VLWGLGQGVGEVNFTAQGAHRRLSKRKKREVAAVGGHWEGWMSMSGARPLHGNLEQPSCCVAGRVAARVKAAPARSAAARDRSP